MKNLKLYRIVHAVQKHAVLIALVLLIPLVYSVIVSGYFYTFDNDELANVQIVYHMAHGKFPYLSFFTTYTPLLHWLLAPVFYFLGFTFHAIYGSRVVMIVLFGIRVIATGSIVSLLFGQWVALSFVLLFLLDPFTVFNGMQIRPDNLMMTLYSLGLLLLLSSVLKKRMAGIAIAGGLIGLALLAMIKIVPGIFMLILFFFWRSARQSDWKTFRVFLVGFLTPLVLFSLYFLFQHALVEMFTHVVLYAKAHIDAVLNPALLGIFYWPDNGYIYGFMGRPPSWWYAWILPIFAFPSALKAVTSYSTKGEKNNKDFILGFLGASLFAHYLSMLVIRSVYTQYYVSLSWLYVLFFILTIRDVLMIQFENPWMKKTLIFFLVVLFSILYSSSIKGNVYRASEFSARELEKKITSRWLLLPPEAPVFLDYLFRPMAYPIPYGFFYGEIPDRALTKMPEITGELARQQLPRLVIGQYAFQFLPSNVQSYIHAHYDQLKEDIDIWVRKN